MHRDDLRATIEDICDNLERQRQTMLATAGTDRTSQPFKFEFDPTIVTYNDMKDILAEVRSRFPQWTIKGEWKT